eukprot:CAMPEP_0181377428 /NCGR_PEP_ID=MMETSP1106-20121128/17892_1 /TAXON_ID=81844 /ORGANISM="Mantoniella antarctica, Strain SL-175" /LENGTH=599 /DNA_ID=CAMNT_0023496163 /DNA_START=188 /DNA_END=1983 /DNA_ORIENTATION=-
MNVSFGLKAGWAQGGSVLAAAVSIGLFSLIKPKVPFTQLEANVCQTVASAAGSMTTAAGLIGPIPALQMLGMRYTVPTIMLWGLSVAYLGVFFAVPLRSHFLLESQLRFPSGTATAETIVSMFADAGRAKEQVTTLLTAASLAALITFTTWVVPWLLKPPVLAAVGLGELAAWGWGLRLDATLVGGGILMGPRVGLSILCGAALSWGCLGPYAQYVGWVVGSPMSMKGGARGLLLWPGVAMMAVDSLTQLALATVCRPKPPQRTGGMGAGAEDATDGAGTPSKPTDGGVKDMSWDSDGTHGGGGGGDHSFSLKGGPTLVGWASIQTRQSLDGGSRGPMAKGHGSQGNQWGGDQQQQQQQQQQRRGKLDDHADVIPGHWWVVGITISGVFTSVVLHSKFGLALWQPLLALPVAGVMSYIAVRCTGETDINPIGPMGKIIQLIFALVAPGAIVTNLMAAAVACGGAGQAGDLMHDFKAGLMMRLSPRKQLIAQLLGIPVGILGAVPTFALFSSVYPLGGEQFPAPAAVAWKAVAEVLTSSANGGGGLPGEAKTMMVGAAMFAVGVRFVEHWGTARGVGWTRWLPSPTSMGIAFIIPPEFST